MPRGFSVHCCKLLVGTMAFGLTGAMGGSLSGLNSDVVAVYTQTSGIAPTNPSYYFYSASGQFGNPGDFTSGTLTFPGPGSPQPLTVPTGGNTFSFGSPTTYLTLSSFQTHYPFGTYTYSLTAGTSPPESESLDYTQSYHSNIPALSATSYHALQSLNTNSALTLTFNASTPNPNANRNYGQFIISDLTQNYAVVYDSGTFSTTTTSVTVPAGTLSSGHQFLYTLYFVDNVDTVDSVQNVQLEQRFDNDTQGTFPTTAPSPTPVPSSIILVTLGLIMVVVWRMRATVV